MTIDEPHFFVTVASHYGRHDADVTAIFCSERSVKRLAELEVLKCAFQEWYERTKDELGKVAT